MTSAAVSPRLGYGEYRNIALVKIVDGAPASWRPCRIDIRLRFVEKVERLGRYYVGKTSRASYQRVLRAAQEEVIKRNEAERGDEAC